MQIASIITKLTAYLPTTWPLQNFIAMNPLWDQIETHLYEKIKTLNTLFPLNGTLSLKQYHDLYQESKISDAALESAILIWIEQRKLPLDHKKENLYQFLLSKDVQKQLEILEQNATYGDERIFQNRGCPLNLDQIKTIKDAVIHFCAAFFDMGQAPWPMPLDDAPLFDSWKTLMSLRSSAWEKTIQLLPEKTERAIYFLAHRLGLLEEENLEDYLLQILLQIKGWASFIKWIEARPNNMYLQKKASIMDLLAIWLTYEVYYIQQNKFALDKPRFFSKPCLDETDQNTLLVQNLWKRWHNSPTLEWDFNLFSLRWIWQTAWEKTAHGKFISLLENKSLSETENNAPLFQAIFCIDTRSEGFRRHLEKLGRCKTFGFAGFFGFPFYWKNKKTGVKSLQSPPLIDPDTLLEYVQQLSDYPLIQETATFINLMSGLKKHPLAPYGLFELVGSWLSIKLVGKTFFPAFYDAIAKKEKTNQLHIENFLDGDICGFKPDQAVHLSGNFLRTIGLTKDFSKFILICGHRSQMENNPYQSSFDCGACGGNAGIPNALVASSILNHPFVRKKLEKQNIFIPSETLFIPACHNTTTDALDILLEENSKFHSDELLLEIKKDLKIAGNYLQKERLKDLPGNRSQLDNRQLHWAELIPELGLVNNMGLIIGPRWLSQQINLERRFFLHSYDPTQDKEGKLLEGILTAPLIIAHWINSQYYFSTTDPEIYGSGNKAIHNVIGKLGVMEGNLSDLKIGLPVQSVFSQNKLLHQPLKLLVVVYANRSHVESIINKHPIIKQLIEGQWIYFHLIEANK